MAGYHRYQDDFDDYAPPQQRWNRDRFDRVRASSRGPPREYDTYRYEESDRVSAHGGERRKLSVDERVERRDGSRFEEDDRYVEEERYRPARRPRPEYLDESEDRYRSAGRELQPYPVRREYVEAEYAERPARAPRRVARPGLARRQSSLDTFDRRPVPRYDEREIDVKIKIDGPPQRRGKEERLRVPEVAELREEDYRDVRIRREKSAVRREPRSPERVSREVIRIQESPLRRGKKGRTRMPKRLVHKSALNELGHTYVEEEDFYVVQIALEKDQIDDVIKISEFYKERRFEEPRVLELPPPPPPKLVISPPPPPEGIGYERVTTKIIKSPTREELERYAVREVERPVRARSRSRHAPVREVFEEQRVVEEIGPGGGQIVLGEPVRRGDREIKAEIRALEAETRALRLREAAEERRSRADRQRELEYARADRLLVEREAEVEIVERRERDVVRVEKDRRGRLNLVRSSH